MNWVDAALLGILQGLTEFLPVSSTAHLIIGARLLHFDDPGGVFTVMIQLGSIFAVMWLYRVKIVHVLRGLPSDADARHFALMIFVAFLPAAIAGALFSSYVKRVLYTTPTVIAASFIAGGIVMLIAERYRPAPRVLNADRTPLGRALAIGACQTLALIPGVSRSGATIVGAMLLGLDRPAAAEFSFFLAMPTMTAAFAHDLFKARHDLSAGRAEEIAIGFVMAFIASAFVVKPFLAVVRRSGFAPFAWYRIAAGLLIIAALAGHWL
ncbi:MAG TPA: undecaprenyl-diphosphate phosphatase [Vicinamibacterales bacterium]|jgi:undecaprenyl-diphosphatase|nr:undecaprenyl-diphosphate phosphatase [Vicinamibacterales bacterium]